MLLTPKEAEKTRCCAYIMNNTRHMDCVADKCMAWRWNQSAQDALSKVERNLELPITIMPPTVGYCGLAGKPECG